MYMYILAYVINYDPLYNGLSFTRSKRVNEEIILKELTQVRMRVQSLRA